MSDITSPRPSFIYRLYIHGTNWLSFSHRNGELVPPSCVWSQLSCPSCWVACSLLRCQSSFFKRWRSGPCWNQPTSSLSPWPQWGLETMLQVYNQPPTLACRGAHWIGRWKWKKAICLSIILVQAAALYHSSQLQEMALVPVDSSSLYNSLMGGDPHHPLTPTQSMCFDTVKVFKWLLLLVLTYLIIIKLYYW